MARIALYFGLLTVGALALTKTKRQSKVNDDVEVWYVNVEKAKERAKCMDNQLKALDIIPHRFEALKKLTPDCTAGGEKRAFMSDWDEQKKELVRNEQSRFNIISNWCSHKQLLSKLYNSSSEADFFMVMEDDTVINEKKFQAKMKQFINEYKGDHEKDWQVVQVDFYGSSCPHHGVGHVGGKTVFKPRNLFKQAPGFKKPLKDSEGCSQYFGGQALLVRRSEIPSIVEDMEAHQTVPLDWLPAQLPRGLAWKPNIAYNSRQYKKTDGHEKACNGMHFQSDIAKGAAATNVLPGGKDKKAATSKTAAKVDLKAANKTAATGKALMNGLKAAAKSLVQVPKQANKTRLSVENKGGLSHDWHLRSLEMMTA